MMIALAALLPSAANAVQDVHLDPQGLIRPELLSEALTSYESHMGAGLDGQIAIVDFSKPSSERRLFLLDLETGDVEALLVAHGQGSDLNHDGMADSFSNEDGSHASSLGAYRAALRYEGGHGLSLALDGLDPTNAAARDRLVVLHSQWYVSDAMVAERGKLGRSWGCFVVDQAVIEAVVDRLEDGGFIYAGL